jgi:ankyrin repeat protein
MEALIAGGAAIDPRDAAGETPLYLAVRKNNKDAIEFLLSKGADPNARDTDGVSPLAAAVKIGSGDLARTLLAAGADPNARDARGRTPLIEAIDSKNSDLAQFLVASGCDILARDADGDSPLTLALKQGDSMLKLVLTPKTANLVDPNGISSLRALVDSKASLAVVELALAAGSRVDGRDRYGDTVLHAALRNGQLDVAARLIKAGADVFSNNANGKSPASIAMAQGADSVKAVFQASGIGVRDKLGNTVLHYAAMTNDTKTAELALSLGADRSAKNIAGESASDIAAKRGYAELSSLLVPGAATVPSAPAATANPPDTQTAPPSP